MPRPSTSFRRQNIYVANNTKPCTVRAFLGLVLNPFVYLVGLLCFFLEETKRKIKKDLALEGLGRIFPLMGNKDNEYGAAGGV